MADAAIIGRGRVLTHAVTGAALPTDATAYGASWGAGWTAYGYSQDDLSMPMNKETNPVQVNELFLPLVIVPTGIDLRIQATYLLTLKTLADAFGVGTFTAASTGGTSDKLEISAGSFNIANIAVGFEVPTQDNYVFRALFHRAQGAGNPNPTFRRTDAATVNTEWAAVGDPANPDAIVLTFKITHAPAA